MYKLVCITDDQTADGFRLAGIDVEVAADIAAARRHVVELLDAEDVGIIAIDQRLSECIDERLERRIDSLYRPVVLMLPLGDTADAALLSENRLRRLIRRAVGFDVTLKRG